MKKPSNNYGHRAAAPGEFTLALSNINDPEALRIVMRLAYDELHRIASRETHREPLGRTLQPTALVNEAFIRLIKKPAAFKNRRHFFTAASTVMRRILIDSARRRRAKKRGGNWRRVDFTEVERLGFEQSSDLLDFNAVLTQLAAAKPQLSKIVELRVFGGWSNTEVANILGLAESTVRRKWFSAREWLHEALASRGKRSGH